MVQIPRLDETLFHTLQFGLSLNANSLEKGDFEFHSAPTNSRLCANSSGIGQWAFLRMWFDTDQDQDSLFAELKVTTDEFQACVFAADDDASPLQLALPIAELLNERKWESTSIERIQSELGNFVGHKTFIESVASYSLDENDIDEQSIIRRMIQLQSEAAQDQFSLTGGQFAIRGRPHESITWFFSESDEVSGTVFGSATEKCRRESLQDATFVLSSNLARLAFAKGHLKVRA